jgi:hypothetical protein
MNAIFEKTCELGMALGWENISLSPGCQEHQVDAHWWFAINPHDVPVSCSKGGSKVPARCIYFQFNGWPAGVVSVQGGLLVTGGLANEETLLAVLEQAIEKAGQPN